MALPRAVEWASTWVGCWGVAPFRQRVESRVSASTPIPRRKLLPRSRRFTLLPHPRPPELAALRKIAGKEKTSVAAIVRRAIHTVLYWADPDLVIRMVESELDAFLKRVGDKFPGSTRAGARKRVLKVQILKAMR